MYFPIPIPLDSEYPVILNWWEPLTVSVIDVDEVVAGSEEEDGWAELEEDGLAVSRRILPMREPPYRDRDRWVKLRWGLGN